MMKPVLALGLVLLLGEANGNPVVNGFNGDSSATEVPNSKDWITFRPSWSFPSLPPVNRLFRSDDGIEENEIQRMKRRIQNLEKAQSDTYKLLRKIHQSRSVVLPCGTKDSVEIKKETSPEINARAKFPVFVDTSSTPASTLTVENITEVEEKSTTSKNEDSQTTVAVESEELMTTISAEILDIPTTPSSEEDHNTSKPSVKTPKA